MNCTMVDGLMVNSFMACGFVVCCLVMDGCNFLVDGRVHHSGVMGGNLLLCHYRFGVGLYDGFRVGFYDGLHNCFGVHHWFVNNWFSDGFVNGLVYRSWFVDHG